MLPSLCVCALCIIIIIIFTDPPAVSRKIRRLLFVFVFRVPYRVLVHGRQWVSSSVSVSSDSLSAWNVPVCQLFSFAPSFFKSSICLIHNFRIRKNYLVRWVHIQISFDFTWCVRQGVYELRNVWPIIDERHGQQFSLLFTNKRVGPEEAWGLAAGKVGHADTHTPWIDYYSRCVCTSLWIVKSIDSHRIPSTLGEKSLSFVKHRMSVVRNDKMADFLTGAALMTLWV